MAKAAIDPTTGQVLCVYNDTVREDDLPDGKLDEMREASSDGRAVGRGPRIGLPDMPEGVEVVDLPEHDRQSFAKEADRKAGAKAGRVWLKGKTIEAEPGEEDPDTAVEGALLGIRKSVAERGGSGSLRVEDIDRAIERERAKVRSGNNRGRER